MTRFDAEVPAGDEIGTPKKKARDRWGQGLHSGAASRMYSRNVFENFCACECAPASGRDACRAESRNEVRARAVESRRVLHELVQRP